MHYFYECVQEIFINIFHYIQQSLIVTDIVETNLKVHEGFNSTFETVGELSLEVSEKMDSTKKWKLSECNKGLLDEFIDDDNVEDPIEESQAKKIEDILLFDVIQ